MISDFRFAFRQLAKNPGFATVAALTLALGIGVNTTMFSVLNALVLRASPAREPARLVSIFRTAPQSQAWPQAPANFYDFQRQNISFESVAGYAWNNVNLAEPGQPAERLPAMAVTGNFFTLFGIAPALGRAIGPEDDQPGVGQVAVLSDRFWRGHFAGDPGVIGRSVRMDGQMITVVGVMRPEFEDPLYFGHIDVWKPLALDGGARQNRDNNWIQAIGRLKPGVTLAQAQAEASALADRLARDYPQTNAQNSLRLEPWNTTRVGSLNRSISWLCMGLAGFVLLIACANLANLQLARVAQRIREHAVRVALGATRAQVMRQLLVENIVMSAIGGAIGVLVALWGTKVIGSRILITGISGYDMPIDTRVLAFTVLASVATGIAVGMVPAWIASRTDVSAALKKGSRGAAGDRSRHLFRKALIVSELALALILLSGAGYFVRGMQRIADADMGWRPDGLITASMSLPFNANYQTDDQCRAFFDRLGSKLAQLPGATDVAISATLPVPGFWRSDTFLVEGRPAPARGKEPLAYYNSVTPGHFSTLGIRVLQGRDFSSADRADTQPVVIINESMARNLWPKENPIGKRIGSADPAHPGWMAVVGVVNDVHTAADLVRSPDSRFQAYRPINQTPSQFVHWLGLAIRSSAPERDVATALRAAVQQIDPDQPVYEVATARDSLEQFTRGFSLTSEMLGAFALIGLVLSAVGIYGVIANLVAQRTSEIGIRMALGAQARDVLWLVLAQGVRMAIFGTAVGVACAWGLIRLLDAILPAIPGGDPVAVALIALLLAAVALFACWLPARRATRIDPIIALRSE